MLDNKIYKHFFRGVAWSASMRWVLRGIGFINVIILARLLTPEDFGIVAMATIIIGFITNFTQMGTQQLLIREQQIDRAMINTSWTINVIQGVLVALVLIASGPLAASYFEEDRLLSIIYVLSLSSVIGGCANIGTTLARKELNFSLDFRANVYTRLATFFVTLVLVFSLRSYWALVYGRLIGSIIEVFVSYRIHPYRPRLCLANFGQYLKFSSSIIPLNMSRYLNEKLDAIVVGGIASAAALGIYNIAADLSKMFTNEIAAPLGRGLMPGYAKLAADPAALALAYSRVLSVASAIIIPVGAGLCLTAEQLIPILLGDQWFEAVSYVQFLSVYAVLLSLQRLMSTQILIVSGHEARAAMLSWIRAVSLLLAALIAARLYGPLGVAMACSLVGIAVMPITMVTLTRSIPIKLGQIISALWRPVLSVMAMALLLLYLEHILQLGEVLSLVVHVISGATVYVSVMVSTWFILGKPEGLEYVIDRAVRARITRQ